MSDRINHAAKAQELLDKAVNENWPDWVPVAQVHATLALVEQQRIANVIALGNPLYTNGSYTETVGANIKASAPDWPEIAAALGVGQ